MRLNAKLEDKKSKSGFELPILDVQKANRESQRNIKRLRDYTNCFRKLQRTFDREAYIEVYNKLDPIITEWRNAGGIIEQPKTFYADARIARYSIVEPENLDTFFEYRLARLTNPNLAIKYAQKRIEKEVKKQERMRAEEREFLRKRQNNHINIAQRFMASQNAINQRVMGQLAQSQSQINSIYQQSQAIKRQNAQSKSAQQQAQQNRVVQHQTSGRSVSQAQPQKRVVNRQVSSPQSTSSSRGATSQNSGINITTNVKNWGIGSNHQSANSAQTAATVNDNDKTEPLTIPLTANQKSGPPEKGNKYEMCKYHCKVRFPYGEEFDKKTALGACCSGCHKVMWNDETVAKRLCKEEFNPGAGHRDACVFGISRYY